MIKPRMQDQDIIGVIPARYGSSRFPGKPLALISGKPLLQHTYENAKKTQLFSRLIIATDDDQIAKLAHSLGAEVVITSSACPTGTDRLAEVVEKIPELKNSKVIVNIQGDEPFVSKEELEPIIDALLSSKEAVMATAITPISHETAQAPSIVKCVTDHQGYALYFSRSPIPYERKPGAQYYRHIGLYAFRPNFLTIYPSLCQTPLQQSEDLEQLKIMEHGYKIKVALVNTPSSLGVDLPEDIQKAEQILCQNNQNFSS